jgi:hypothetical protein
MVAIPAYGGSIKNGCVLSLLKLQHSLHTRGLSAEYGILSVAGISEVRNFYASILLQRAEHSHLLFVDSDMAFEPSTFWKLVDAQKPFVGCIYPKRKANAGFVVYNHGPIRAKNGLARVEGIGMGLCLIQAACFRALLNTGQIAKYSGHGFESHGLLGPLLGFFDPVPKDGEYTAEDYAFCYRWRTLCGGDVWALASEDVGHIGEYIYRGKPDVIEGGA